MSAPPTPGRDFLDRHPGLHQLFGGYLNNAVDYLYGTWEDAVEGFVAASADDIASAVAGLDELLQMPVDDPTRLAVLTVSCLDNTPEPDPDDELFLAWMHQRLREAVT